MALLNDFKISDGQLVAKETGVEIPLNFDFAREVVRVGSFVWFIQALRASRMIRGREPRAKISFFPRKPRSYYAIWPVCQLADVKIVNDHEEADLHFYFEDCEFLNAPRSAPSDKAAFNVGCHDIRKSVITKAFEDTFGYGLGVDPVSHGGLAVEKSEGNGKHDGKIVSCPVAEPRPGMVYQRLVDNTFDGREFVDIRTPVVGGKIPFVYLKRRHRDLRFSNDNHRVDIVDADTMLSRDEQLKIEAYAKALRLDFGGLDVLRNREDGKIYIVDANKTDMGPPSALSGPCKMRAMRGLADAFADLVDSSLPA